MEKKKMPPQTDKRFEQTHLKENVQIESKYRNSVQPFLLLSR